LGRLWEAIQTDVKQRFLVVELSKATLLPQRVWGTQFGVAKKARSTLV
jgi:hypothetical protein